MTPSGIEIATFRLVAQSLNQLRDRMPPATILHSVKWQNENKQAHVV
jgi:hypothetical protein